MLLKKRPQRFVELTPTLRLHRTGLLFGLIFSLGNLLECLPEPVAMRLLVLLEHQHALAGRRANLLLHPRVLRGGLRMHGFGSGHLLVERLLAQSEAGQVLDQSLPVGRTLRLEELCLLRRFVVVALRSAGH